MKFLALLALASHFTATNAFYPYQFPGSRPARRDALHSTEQPSFKLALHKVKRSNVFRIVHSDDPSAPNSAAIDQDGSDYSYMCEVQFGANKKPFSLLLDSAAINSWLIDSTCTSTSCTTHNTFGTSDSSSLHVSDNTFSIAYGTGSVSGTVATDNVNFLGKSFPLTFGLANNVSEEFSSYPMDGILGVGQLGNVVNNPNGVKAPTLVDVLFSEKIISSKVFGLRLSRTSDGHNNGEVNFGAPDTSAFTGDLHYVPALKNDRGFWEIAIDSVKFDGKSAAIQQEATALLDSGTSFLLLPPADAQAIHSQIPGSAQEGESFTIPCDTKIPLVISFGDKAFSISPKDYIAAPSGGKCLSNIVARQTFKSNQWLVGDVFLKNVYTLYDFQQSRVGIAQLSGKLTISTVDIHTQNTSTSQPPTGGTTASSAAPTPSPTQQHTIGSAAPGETMSSQAPNPPTTIELQGTSSRSIPSATSSVAPMVSGSNSTSNSGATASQSSNGSSKDMSYLRSSCAAFIFSIVLAHFISFS